MARLKFESSQSRLSLDRKLESELLKVVALETAASTSSKPNASANAGVVAKVSRAIFMKLFTKITMKQSTRVEMGSCGIVRIGIFDSEAKIVHMPCRLYTIA